MSAFLKMLNSNLSCLYGFVSCFKKNYENPA